MPTKPNANTILQTYDMDELLELVREKSEQDAKEQVDELKKGLAELAEEYTSGNNSSSKAREKGTAEKTRRGRPKGTRGKSVGVRRGRAGSKRMSLGQHLQQVIGSDPMGINDIMEAVRKNGYTSNAQDPRRVLYLELKKQVENNNLKKAGRGKYESA